MLLDLYARIAKPISRWSVVLWLVLAASAGWFLYELFRPAGADGRVPISLIVFLWAAFLIAVGQCFAVIPPPVDPRAKFAARVVARVKRGSLWMLAIVTTALFGLVALLSVRAAGMYVHAFWD